jgi:eukaryotic-like serine/threonine-protein kinase
MWYPRLRTLFVFPICCLVLFLAACSPGSTTGNGGTPTSTTTTGHPGGSTPTSTPAQTQNVPPTQTSCPSGGTGRAFVTAHLALGSRQSLVYVYNVGSPAHPGTSFLKRFDAVGGASTTIATFANTYVTNAQVSADGQWILFVDISGGQEKLQAIRLDGQGLQTLYCSSSLLSPQWSTDQRHVIFDQDSGATTHLFLLDITSGNVQQVFSDQSNLYMPLTWLDNARIYLVHQPTDAPADSLYLLDTSKGAHQTASDLRIVYKQNVDASHYQCWNADSSYSGLALYVAECTAPINTQHPGLGAVEGPSKISFMSSVGNEPTPLYQTSVGGITTVRAITSSLLLFTVDSQAFDTSLNVDTSQNGLWVVNTNGSGAMRLTNMVGYLNNFSQFPWSNVSRDGSYYSLQIANDGGLSLAVGSLSGGAPGIFATTTSGTTSDLIVAGWTLF